MFFRIALFLLFAGNCLATVPQLLKIEKCKIERIDATLQCAYFEVPENWNQVEGRTILLRAVIFPAAEPNPDKKALFHIEGGPGFSPVDVGANFYATDGKGYWKTRDVVLLEQRGTGESNPLHCPQLEKRSQFEEVYPVQLVAECRKELEKTADLTQYNSVSAVQDLETVRKLLGYSKIDFWAQSYGTRVVLLYLSRYPENVRTAALQATVSLNAKLPLYHAANAESVLRRLFEQCRKDHECNVAYPDLFIEWQQVLKKTPEKQRSIITEAIRKHMYSTDTLRRLPYFIHELARGVSAEKVFGKQGGGPPAYEGAYLSITCLEDVPWISDEEEKKQTANTSFGNYRIEEQKNACRQWIPATQRPLQFKPTKSDVPILFFVGTMDAVTPPEWSLERSRTLPNSRVISIPEMGHLVGGLSNLDCYDRMTLQFLQQAGASKLDTSCITTMKPPKFFTNK